MAKVIKKYIEETMGVQTESNLTSIRKNTPHEIIKILETRLRNFIRTELSKRDQTNNYCPWSALEIFLCQNEKPCYYFQIYAKIYNRTEPFYDRFHTLRYNITRNRLAAGIAFVSGVLLLLSGYKATLEIYHLITQQIILHTSQQFWIFLFEF